MRSHKKAGLIIILILTLTSVAPVAAQVGEDPPLPACTGESVAGTVVEVDEAEGVVTVYTDGTRCTVTLDGEYDHPIVALLGRYFGDVSADSLEAALDTTQGCAVQVGDSWMWAECEEGVTTPITIIGENDDGTFTFTATVDDAEVTGTVSVDDTGTAADLSEALETLLVDWELDADGAVIQPGDEIAAYHDEGIGFGVLVKLYTMAAESLEEECDDPEEACGVTVEELVEAFQSGVGMGELFKDYGKPSNLGVGHIRNGKRGRADRPSQLEHGRWTNRLRPSGDAVEPTGATLETDVTKPGKPDQAGPKPKPADQGGKPDHAGPKPKPADQGGKPDHAGPKPKSKGK